MAEAYMNSYLYDQHITGVEVLSSGTIAADRYEYTRAVAAHTRQFLGSKGLEAYIKSDSDQLTPDLVMSGDITICMNQKVRESCRQIVQLPDETTFTWDITDSDEGDLPPPVPGDAVWLKHTEHIYGQITGLVHDLVRREIG